MNEPFTWERNRRSLTVMPERVAPGAVSFHAYDAETDCGVELEIPPHEVAGLAVALALSMHEAAGLPAPVILDRPEPMALFNFAGATFAVRHGGGVDASVSAGGTTVGHFYRPPEFRRALAVLAAMADASENEPDPAEVEELARAIHGHRCTGACDEGPDSLDRTSAEAALRWMRDREAQS